MNLANVATPTNLQRVEAAERLVRSVLQLQDRHNMRVRHISSAGAPAARVEIDAEILRGLEGQAQDADSLQNLAESVSALGFSSVSFAPFRSGSLSIPASRDLSSSAVISS